MVLRSSMSTPTEAIRPQDSSSCPSTRGGNPSCNRIRSSPAMAISRPALLLLVLYLSTTTISASPKPERDVTELQIGVKFKPTICDLKAHKGDHVSVHYRGTLLDGTEFDESYGRGEPLDFKLGEGTVIKGWDQGLLGMCAGEKRKLKIPAKLGYGEEGAPPEIPGGATLIFETELVSVNGKTGSGPDDVLEPLMDPNFEEEEEFGDEEEFGGRNEFFDQEEEL